LITINIKTELQSIYDIASICAGHGIQEAILSPGSRCAPLTISFARHPGIQVRTISDERSAGFIAAGLAQQTAKPVVLICTSGSAGLNYSPAVAEAFYQQIPLLILTADRPPEWVDQLDGQTIRQQNLFGRHVKAAYQLPVDTTHSDAQWEVNRILNEAILQSTSFPAGPVHVNIPLREPFYPESDIQFNTTPRIIKLSSSEAIPDASLLNELTKEINSHERIMIVAGQGHVSSELQKTLHAFIENTGAVLIADTISNTGNIEQAIQLHDVTLSAKEDSFTKTLAPDLLITFGKSVISKSLKQFLRAHKPQHWHIQPAGDAADTFQCMSRLLRFTPEAFFRTLTKTDFTEKSNFQLAWNKGEEKAKLYMKSFFQSSTFTEFNAIHTAIQSLPAGSQLHLANSMPVRYANYLPLAADKHIEVFANRGTSGIDGVLSTAVGACMGTDKIVTVITGDMSFFYDRNAFWNNYLPANLRVIILNNHGGGIFRMINGPSQQPELEQYFVTEQKLTAEYLAKEHQLNYYLCKDEATLTKALSGFFKPSEKPQIIEVITDGIHNTNVFQQFKANIPKFYV